MRKTPLFGFNLFYHDEPIIAAEDIRPGASYTGPLQSDPQNTLNYNFKRMDFVLQSILDGTLSFTSFRTAGGHTPLSPGDVGVGGDLYVQGSLILNAESPLVLVRDHRPSPHYILDFADALVHAGFDGARNVSLSVGGTAYAASDRLNPFTPDTSGIRFQGNGVYPLVYTVSSAQPLFSTQHSAQARLLLAFDAIPQGLTRIRLEASYDGSAYTVLGQFTDGLGNKSILLPSVTFAQAPKALRVTLEGTNSTATDFTLTRLSLLHAGTPALENFYLPRRGGQLWGDLQLPASKLIFGADTNLYRSAADTLKTDDSLVVGGNLTLTGDATLGDSPSDVVRVKGSLVAEQGLSGSNNAVLLINGKNYGVEVRIDEDWNGLDSFRVTKGSGTELLRVQSDGKVGIGAPPTSERLEVGGNVKAVQFISTATPGTAPFQVSSTTAVTNLNADLVDGLHGTSFARVDASSTISQPWTLNANLSVGAGYTLDGVDLSVFKSAYDVHEHNGADAPKVKAENVLTKPYGGASYTTDVKSYLDGLQNQINNLVQGATTANSILVQNLTVTQTLSASGVTAQVGALNATGASSFGDALTLTTANPHLILKESGIDSAPATVRKTGGRLELATGSTSPVRIYRGTSAATSDLEVVKDTSASTIPSYLRFAQTGKYDVLLKGSDVGVEIRNWNDTSYLPFKAGHTTVLGDLNVSGSISGNLSGNANTASRWQAARTLTLTGLVTGSATMDGSADVSLVTSIANGSITGAMLASGAAAANLGYSPVNRAGDTMTGGLTLVSAAMSVNLSDTYGGGVRLIDFKTGSGVLQWGIGHIVVPGGNNTGNNFAIWRYDDDGNYLSQVLAITRANGFVGINKPNPDYRFVVEEPGNSIAVAIRKTNNGSNGSAWNGPALLVEHTYGNHSWGNVAEFRVDTGGGNDPPNVTFTAGWTGTGWAVGMAGQSDPDFAIVTNRGWRFGNFGTVQLRVKPDGQVITSGTLTPGMSSGFAGHINGSGPIKFSNGGAAQEIYVRKVRASAGWATNDANDPGDGGGFFSGRLFVQNNSGWNGTPAIALAIGDNDTGLHWGGDGVINAYANSSRVFGWNPSQVVFYTGKQVIVQGSLIIPVK
jgi:hypothetical protein